MDDVDLNKIKAIQRLEGKDSPSLNLSKQKPKAEFPTSLIHKLATAKDVTYG